MIDFVMQFNEAIIFNNVGSENGWIFKYDAKNRSFLVWDNGEREIEGKPGIVCETLEQVLRLVNSYT